MRGRPAAGRGSSSEAGILSGVNTPYEVTLQYTSRQPPNDLLVPVNIHQSTPWPDTTGSLSQTGLAVNGVVRFGDPSRVSATLSGGLTGYWLSGTVQPVARVVVGLKLMH